MDAFALTSNWKQVGYEIKVSKQDYLNDNKWYRYLQYCNQFSFVCPEGLISPDDVESSVGLIWVNDSNLPYTVKKAPHKPIVCDTAMFYRSLLTVLLDRESDSQKKAKRLIQAEQWIRNKQQGKIVSHLVNDAIRKEIYQLRERIRLTRDYYR